MTADLVALPAAGDPCRVIAWLAGRDGRKLTAGSALIGRHGEVLAAASTLWLTVPRPAPAPVTAAPVTAAPVTAAPVTAAAPAAGGAA
jgi:hypothetical protein